MSFDIEYKQGDTDTVGAVLSTDGTPIDLTDLSVSFVMKDDLGTRIIINCTLGCVYNGTTVGASSGGVTIHFTSTSTAKAGIYTGEFIVTNSLSESVRFPSGDNYLQIRIWDAI